MDAASQRRLEVPEPDLKPEQLISRARALRPMVQAEAQEAERRGYYSEALHNEFTKAGFYRCLQPRRLGGYEFSIRTFFKSMIEIAAGDPGIGWCLTLACGHALQIGTNFDEAAQARILVLIGHFIAPYSPSGPWLTPNALPWPVAIASRANGATPQVYPMPPTSWDWHRSRARIRAARRASSLPSWCRATNSRSSMIGTTCWPQRQRFEQRRHQGRINSRGFRG